MQARLAAAGWTEGDLAKRPKAAPGKIKLARELRRQTPMTRQWIAQRLHMGSASYVSHLTRRNYRLLGQPWGASQFLAGQCMLQL
ncbi:MAG TPA: hypothetical protein P5555_05575 [Candidatus Paceibacterota bacterium]|nr:hypothetical protein [Verrucomicrobiota bacterium]HRZ44640.1 hypothetical protein [Candidatus Paceibacterota bacterium]